jgi:hypothetical protein
MSRRFAEPKRITCNHLPNPFPLPMPTLSIENIIVDEANHRTYIVMAPRVLSDGEVYQAIRREILKRKGQALAPGESLSINTAVTGTHSN